MTIKEKLLEWWIRPEMYYIKRYLRFLRQEEKYTFQRAKESSAGNPIRLHHLCEYGGCEKMYSFPGQNVVHK